MSTRDLLAALPALTEVLTELSTRDLPELCLIGAAVLGRVASLHR